MGGEMTMLFDGAVNDALDFSDLPMQAVSAVRTSTERKASLSRAEAEFLFIMDRTGQIGEQRFVEAAVRAIRDHLVREGDLSETDVDWLLGMVGDRPTAFGRAAVFAVVKACDGAPQRLTEVAMRAAVGRCLLV
jgi:hypothetical protein